MTTIPDLKRIVTLLSDAISAMGPELGVSNPFADSVAADIECERARLCNLIERCENGPKGESSEDYLLGCVLIESAMRRAGHVLGDGDGTPQDNPLPCPACADHPLVVGRVCAYRFCPMCGA